MHKTYKSKHRQCRGSSFFCEVMLPILLMRASRQGARSYREEQKSFPLRNISCQPSVNLMEPLWTWFLAWFGFDFQLFVCTGPPSAPLRRCDELLTIFNSCAVVSLGYHLDDHEYRYRSFVFELIKTVSSSQFKHVTDCTLHRR